MRSINLGRWSRRVERYFNIKGGGGLMDVDQSIRVVLPIASGVEERNLEGWNRYSIGGNSAAVAAQFGVLQLRNPANSGTIAVIERMSAWCGAAIAMQVNRKLNASDYTANANVNKEDPRQASGAPAIVLTNGTAAAITGANMISFALVANGTPYELVTTPNNEIMIAPTDSVSIWAVTANTLINWTVMWRERSLETSELTG